MSKSVARGWAVDVCRPDGFVERLTYETPDERLARSLGLLICTEALPATPTKPARKVHRLIIPPQLVPLNHRARSRLFAAARSHIELSGAHHESFNVQSDAVIETVLKNGRTIWRPSFLSRVEQRMVLLAIQPRAELEMCESSHAYRIGRSRFTALRAVAINSRRYPFVVPVDIVGFFKSVSPKLAEAAIARVLKWVHWSLRRVIYWLLTPPVVLRPNHPRFRPEGSTEPRFLKGLPEGGVLPPFAANIVVDAIVGRPFELLAGDMALVRFSDNFAVMGRTASHAAAGVSVIADLLRPEGLQLHEPWPDPIDIRVVPLDWLGKRVHGRSVQTPSGDVERFVTELSRLDPSTHAFRHGVRRVMTELSLDGPRRLDFVSRRVRASSRLQAVAFDLLRGARLTPLGDAEPDDFDAFEDEVAS